MKYLRAAIGTATLMVAVGASSSSTWDLRRNVSNGACFIQPSDSSPIGALLKTHPTRKEACEDAKARQTDDAGDTTKCFGYTSGTKDACSKEGVDLND